MTNEQLIHTVKEAMRNDTVLNKGMVELLCDALVAVTEQRDALVVEMSIVKNDYATIPEVKCIGWPNTPNFDAAIAALRAEGFDSAFDEEPFGHIRRCGAFVIIEVNGDPHIKDGMPVFARQLRESKGANHEA